MYVCVYVCMYVCMYVYVNDKSGGSPIATGSNIGCHLFGICSLCTLIILLSVYICVNMCMYVYVHTYIPYLLGLTAAVRLPQEPHGAGSANELRHHL